MADVAALIYDGDERMLVDVIGSLLTRVAPVSAFRQMRDSGGSTRHVAGLWPALVHDGFAAPHLPDAYGGAGMGYAAAGLVAEALGGVLGACPFLSTAVVIELLLAAGSLAQRTQLLPPLAGGSLRLVFAVDEAARHDPGRLETRAVRHGDGWRIDGNKRFVLDAVGADLIVVACAGPDGLVLLLVDPSAPGVALQPLDLIDSRNAADIMFSRVRVEASSELGAGDPVIALERALDVGRVLLAAELVGIATAGFERTIAYLKQRVQFGRPIGSFQALQHRAARMYVALELARGAVLKALRARDAGTTDAAAFASLAKTVASRVARELMDEAVQMHGGIGMTDELDIGLFFKRARVAGETFGDDRFHLERLARLRWGL